MESAPPPMGLSEPPVEPPKWLAEPPIGPAELPVGLAGSQ